MSCLPGLVMTPSACVSQNSPCLLALPILPVWSISQSVLYSSASKRNEYTQKTSPRGDDWGKWKGRFLHSPVTHIALGGGHVAGTVPTPQQSQLIVSCSKRVSYVPGKLRDFEPRPHAQPKSDFVCLTDRDKYLSKLPRLAWKTAILLPQHPECCKDSVMPLCLVPWSLLRSPG